MREFKESVVSEEVECCHIYVLAHPVCCFETLINSCGLQLSTRQAKMEVYVFCLHSARAGRFLIHLGESKGYLRYDRALLFSERRTKVGEPKSVFART